uniref:Uncharacterized protein n=1 Tax=Crocodylus porosus TaxID=8502 RepID=A0A7M4FW49_CROPO
MHAGLTCHPDWEHFVYPLSCTVVTESLNNSQSFLHGHINNVSCAALSLSRCYIIPGQVTFMGFKISFCGTMRRKSCLLGCRFTREK